MQKYQANGKLLISGEYLVLKGALALAVPCRQGQSLTITEGKDASKMVWTSLYPNGEKWMELVIDPESLNEDINKKDSDLLKVLKQAVLEQPDFKEKICGKHACTQLEFPREWGLGSSSTLVSLIAQWSGANPFNLNKTVFGSSGYDIACAKSWMPIFYKIDEEGQIWDSVHFTPPSASKLVFVYLGKKQNSASEVLNFKANKNKFKEEINIISEISEALLFCDYYADFLTLLDEHEQVMQFVLQKERVQTALFNDYPGVVKSLGAWGGDFVLAGSDMDSGASRSYFNKLGYETVIPYNEMVLLNKPKIKKI